jgi:hypothetical protein
MIRKNFFVISFSAISRKINRQNCTACYDDYFIIIFFIKFISNDFDASHLLLRKKKVLVDGKSKLYHFFVMPEF